MKTLLVTGASGFLGWNICQKAKLDWTIVGTFCSRFTIIPFVKLIKVDLTVYSELKQLFKDVKPSAVIHTAAISNPNFCQENRDIIHFGGLERISRYVTLIDEIIFTRTL
jgi:dTDP-4-dehydrorhamnose reductase